MGSNAFIDDLENFAASAGDKLKKLFKVPIYTPGPEDRAAIEAGPLTGDPGGPLRSTLTPAASNFFRHLVQQARALKKGGIEIGKNLPKAMTKEKAGELIKELMEHGYGNSVPGRPERIMPFSTASRSARVQKTRIQPPGTQSSWGYLEIPWEARDWEDLLK